MSAVISLSREECLRLHESLRREWLETDGRGGFASSTVLLCPTRRYHGLLLASVAGPSQAAQLPRSLRGGRARRRARFPTLDGALSRHLDAAGPSGHPRVRAGSLPLLALSARRSRGPARDPDGARRAGRPLPLRRAPRHARARAAAAPAPHLPRGRLADVREPRARSPHRAHHGRHPHAPLPRAAAARHHRRRRPRRASRPTRSGTARSSTSATSSAATTATRTSGARAGSTCRSSPTASIVVAIEPRRRRSRIRSGCGAANPSGGARALARSPRA